VNTDVIITCAVTGGSQPVAHRPKTPKEIAAAAIDAAKAGAAIVHVHVRDPQTGASSLGIDYYREVVDIIRSSNVDVILNLTTGPGAGMILEDREPFCPAPGSDIVPALERMRHVEELLPEICSFDCCTFTFGEQLIEVITLEMGRKLARRMKELGVRPEIEVFDMGTIEASKIYLREGLIDDPPCYCLCLGIIGNAPATPEATLAMRDMLPPGAQWSAFGVSRWEMPMVAQTVLAGGNVRVGLEDNIWLTKGVPATNAQLVEKAVGIIESLGARVATTADARARLKLRGTT
jgi:uncharacterized protein (DUF849 family)